MLFSFLSLLLSPLRFAIQWRRNTIALFLSSFFITTTLPADNNQSAMMQALFAKAFGKKADVPSKSTADLRINNINYEQQVTVYINEEKIIDRVKSTTLLTLFETILTEDFFKQIKPQLQSHEKITFAQLAKLGINTHYDSASLSLNIEINPDLQKPRLLSMRHKGSATLRASNRIQANDIGGYLNLYSNLSTSTTLADPALKLRLESSLNIHGYVLESMASKDNEQWTLGDTTLTYDRSDKLYRYQAGDIATLTKGFQDTYSLTGISLSKNFFMDPKLQIKPRANSTFTLSTKSTVEVYLNGTLQKTFQLDEGKYSLEDIGLLDGANNIDIKIKDEFGKITYKTTSEYYDTQLLKPELSTFSSSLGLLKDIQEQTSTPLVKQLIFSSYYQQGLYKNLTLGLDLQFSHDRNLVGFEAITSNQAGRVKFNVGLSQRREGGIGEAVGFTYHPNSDIFLTKIGLDRFIRSMNFRGEYRSRYFDQLIEKPELITPNPFIQSKLQSNIAFNLGKQWEASLTSGFSRNYNDTNEYFATGNLSKRFQQGIKWNISAEYQSNDDLRIQTQLHIPLSSKLFSRRQDITLNYDSKAHRFAGVYNLHRLGAVGENSIGGEVKYTDNDINQQLNTQLTYKNNRVETRLNAQQNNLSQQLNIGINSALLCAGSDCTVSYPVIDSFALVKGPASQEKPIAIKNGYGKFHYPDNSDSELPDNYSALITDKDSSAVVSLDSYKYQRISIDEGGLPFGYDPEKTEFEFIPQYHSSFTLIAGGKPGTVVTGQLIDNKKQGMSFKGGQWVAEQQGGKIIAFFTNKTGYFHLPSVPAGRYNIELFDHPSMQKITVDIPDKQGETYTLKALNVIEK